MCATPKSPITPAAVPSDSPKTAMPQPDATAISTPSDNAAAATVTTTTATIAVATNASKEISASPDTTIVASATAWARAAVPVAQDVGASVLEVALCEQQYREVLQNLRGLIGRLWSQQARQRSLNGAALDPTTAQYRILGMEGESPLAERPLQVSGRDQQLLARLCVQVMERLTSYVHCKLLAWGEQAAKQELESARAEQESASSTAVASVAPAMTAKPATPVPAPAASMAPAPATAIAPAAEANDTMVPTAMPKMRVKHLVVGMSGGPDSTLALVLAVALQQSYGYRVTAVHCIHGLDPDDAIWLKHNQDLCASLGVTLKTPRLNIVYGAGRSPEEVSRAERYQALLRELQADSCLVLGHQADDQVENLLLALKRGAGPQGLGGMKLLTQDERGLLLRPLLALHKSEIEQILTQLGFDFVYDLSNSYLKFERNFVRLKILPLLRERFAGIDKALLRSQQLCAYEHDLAERLVAEKLGAYLTTNVYGAEGYSFNFAHLDVGDRPLLIMLLRSWVQQTVGFSAELNLLEHCSELMLKPHDRNGEVLFAPSAYVASTFLHYLCLYRPLTTATQQALERLSKAGAAPVALTLDLYNTMAQSGQDQLAEPAQPAQPAKSIQLTQSAQAAQPTLASPAPLTGQVVSSARIGELSYHLIALDPSEVTARTTNLTAPNAAAVADPVAVAANTAETIANIANSAEAAANIAANAAAAVAAERTASLEREASRLASLEVHTPLGTFSIRAHSCFAVSPEVKTLYLYFAYAQSLKLKPQWRVHSRECKKLMLEYKVAPWIRTALPLVCTASGQVLACANLWAQDPKVEVKVPWAMPNSVQSEAQASNMGTSTPLYLALAITREPV